jgi:protein phosphatase
VSELQTFASVLTDPGRKRPQNEDSAFGDDQAGVFIVADGSGHRPGVNASGDACSIVMDHLTKADQRVPMAMRLYGAVAAAATRVAQLPGKPIVTMCVVVRDGHGIWIASVGDARAYLLRNGRLARLTRDHRLGNEPGVDPGLPEARANMLTRAIGSGAIAYPDLRWERILAGDVLMLCSDGLWQEIDDARLEHLLGSELSLDEACGRLIEEANARGGRDNISVVVVCIVG